MAPNGYSVSPTALCAMVTRNGGFRVVRCISVAVGPCFDVEKDAFAKVDPAKVPMIWCEQLSFFDGVGSPARSICASKGGSIYLCTGMAAPGTTPMVQPQSCESRILRDAGVTCPVDTTFYPSSATTQVRPCTTGGGRPITCLVVDAGPPDVRGVPMQCSTQSPPPGWTPTLEASGVDVGGVAVDAPDGVTGARVTFRQVAAFAVAAVGLDGIRRAAGPVYGPAAQRAAVVFGFTALLTRKWLADNGYI